MNKKYWFYLLILFVAPAMAEFTIDTPLHFGEIAIRNNNSVSTVSILRDGTQQSTNQIYIVKPGSPGVFTLSNYPPYTNINLSVDLPATSNMSYPQTAQFSITSVDLPSSINTGSLGIAQFKMGAILSTSGNGTRQYYSGATYQIYLHLNLDY
jgi:hypothetical protein